MIKDPAERSERCAALMREMLDACEAGTLNRAGWVRLAKQIITVVGDGFAHDCTLAGTGSSFRAWKKVKKGPGGAT